MFDDELYDDLPEIEDQSQDAADAAVEPKWYVIHSEPTEPNPQPEPESVGAWEKVQAEAERRGLIVKQRIGNAACMLFKARQLVEIYAEARRTDPFGLYNLKREAGNDI